MKLEKLPSIIANTQFDRHGFAKTDHGLLVPAYIASQFGFSAGKYSPATLLDDFYEALIYEAGVLPLCPFKACGEYLDFSKIEKTDSNKEILEFWQSFNQHVGPVNYGTLMPRAKFMIAIFDGGQTIDDGVAAEVAYFAEKYKYKKIVFGIRSDLRLAENPAAPINPAIRYFLDEGPYKGKLFGRPEPYQQAIDASRDYKCKLIEHIVSNRK